MGAIAGVINSVDPADNMLNAAKQMIQMGETMLNAKFKIFQSQLNNPIGQLSKLPAKTLITSSKKIAMNFTKNQESLKDTVKSIVESFVQGNIVEGIVNLLLSALDAMMGTFSASYNQSQDYLAIVNPMGGIFRIDYLVVQQKIDAKGIKEKVEDIFGSYLVVSAVQKEEVKNDNVYRVIVGHQFPNATLTQQFALIRLINTETDKLDPDLIKQIEGISPEPPKKFKQLHFQNKKP